MDNNRIRVGGGNALASALVCSKSLARLRLSKNRLGDAGAEALARALAANNTLTALQ